MYPNLLLWVSLKSFRWRSTINRVGCETVAVRSRVRDLRYMGSLTLKDVYALDGMYQGSGWLGRLV